MRGGAAALLDMRSALLGILCIISQSSVGGFMFLPLSRLNVPALQAQKVQTCKCGIGQLLVRSRTHTQPSFLALLRAQSVLPGSENVPDFADMAAIAGGTWEGILVKFGANGAKNPFQVEISSFHLMVLFLNSRELSV
jgi:hypothetical protein